MAERPGALHPTSDEGLKPLPGLSADEHRTLAYASAIGREFAFPLLAAAMGADEESLSEQLERLAHRGILRERVGGDRFVFVDDEFRARVYRSLTASRLRIIHRKVAEALERMYPTPPDDMVAELGRHYFLGKVHDRSLEYNRRAAELASASDDPEGAAQHLARVRLELKALPERGPTEAAQVAERLGDLSFSLGDVRAADAYYTEALEGAGRDDGRIRARLTLARAEVARENLNAEAATRGGREALQLFEDSGDQLGAASAFRLLGRVAFYQGDYRGALEESMRALDLLTEAQNLRLLGRLSIDIGNSFAMMGPDVREEARTWYERAIDRLTQAGDWAELSRAYHNLGVTVGMAHPADGLEFLERAREYGERAHDPRTRAWSLLSSVEMRLAVGEVDEAARDNEQASRLIERLVDELGVQQVEMNRGLIAEKKGQWDEAQRGFRSAIERARRYHLTAEEAESHFHLARLLYKTRDLPGAREALRAATDLDLPGLKPHLAGAFQTLADQIATADPGGESRESPPGERSAADGRL